jgi:hypothetical protein
MLPGKLHIGEAVLSTSTSMWAQPQKCGCSCAMLTTGLASNTRMPHSAASRSIRAEVCAWRPP